MKDLAHYRRGKLYDFVMGAPLILWFGYGLLRLRPNLVFDARAFLDDPGDFLALLRFLALAASAGFNLLLIWLLTIRQTPVRRSAGLSPRLCGFAGTFLGVAILQLKVATLSLGWEFVAVAFVFAGALGSVIVLAKLGRAFSIMPEARLLVTSGPYAWARHPLYAVETLSLVGTAIQFVQPWAALLAVAVVALQVTRSIYEERVLVAAYPEYAAYRARVKRFGVI